MTSYELSLQFVELYNEQLLDLFGAKQVVDVTMDPNGGYRCKDAVTHVCKNYDEAMAACVPPARRNPRARVVPSAGPARGRLAQPCADPVVRHVSRRARAAVVVCADLTTRVACPHSTGTTAAASCARQPRPT